MRDPPFCVQPEGCPDIMACASFGIPRYCGIAGTSIPEEPQPLCDRITEYLQMGGLWNPELANHDVVRNLLIDCRSHIELLQSQLDQMEINPKECRCGYPRKTLTTNRGVWSICEICDSGYFKPYTDWAAPEPLTQEAMLENLPRGPYPAQQPVAGSRHFFAGEAYAEQAAKEDSLVSLANKASRFGSIPSAPTAPVAQEPQPEPDALVERLREATANPQALTNLAADRIVALQQRVLELDRYGVGMDKLNADLFQQKERAEAELAQARKLITGVLGAVQTGEAVSKGAFEADALRGCLGTIRMLIDQAHTREE